MGGVLVAAVTGVDDRDAGITAGAQRGTLLGVAHGDDIGVAGHHTDGVGHTLALGSAGDRFTGEAQHMAAQVQHSGLKGEAGASGWLVEQGGKLFVLGDVLVGGRVGADAVGQTQQIHDFFLAEV